MNRPDEKKEAAQPDAQLEAGAAQAERGTADSYIFSINPAYQADFPASNVYIFSTFAYFDDL